jgi:uncharacterized ParB-like nuclease family protein
VPLNRIKGSVNPGRGQDFDKLFRPRHHRTAERWISIARAAIAKRSLPPVRLVRTGGVYYVSDGHHRISVAQALGQTTIDALVVEV